MSAWTIYNMGDAQRWPKFRKSGGCYVVFGNGKLIYVGQSDNLKRRFGGYSIRFGYGSGIFTKWGDFHSLIVKVKYGKRQGDWLMTEYRLIKRLSPPSNSKGIIKRLVVKV